VTYRAVFPAIIPPPFFNSLITTVYSYRAATTSLVEGAADACSQYFAHEIVEWLRVDRVGCVDCCTPARSDATSVDGDDAMSRQQSLYHQMLIEMSAQLRVIQVSQNR